MEEEQDEKKGVRKEYELRNWIVYLHQRASFQRHTRRPFALGPSIDSRGWRLDLKSKLDLARSARRVGWPDAGARDAPGGASSVACC